MNKNTTRQPWRVVASEGFWQVWTAYDSTPGSRNNYVIADGIQSEEEANLIAQAPAMLEALRSICAASTIPGFWIPKECVESIRAVIAKAEGRE